MYRFFAITFLRKYIKITWLAVLIPAVIWALGHAYLDPVWVKEGQIFAIGLALGGLFPYLGLEGCIIAHYVLNIASLVLAM